MAKRNPSHRRSKKKALKKKNITPVGLIIIGVGIILVGIAIFVLMPKSDSSSSAVDMPKEYSSIPMEVKFDAPQLALTNLEGETESLKDYRGEVLMVNLWATWCPPCVAEIPMLQEYYEVHRADGFVMLGIDSQETPEVIAKYIENVGVTYPIWVDEKGAAGQAFSSFSLPSSFIIDREGTVRFTWTGAISRAVLEEYLTPIIEE